MGQMHMTPIAGRVGSWLWQCRPGNYVAARRKLTLKSWSAAAGPLGRSGMAYEPEVSSTRPPDRDTPLPRACASRPSKEAVHVEVAHDL